MTWNEGLLTGVLVGSACDRLEALGYRLGLQTDEEGNYRPEVVIRGPHGVELLVRVTETRRPERL